jgi:hypothetical protein
VALGLLEMTAFIVSGNFALRIASMFEPRPEIRMTTESITIFRKSLPDGAFQQVLLEKARGYWSLLIY